MEENFAWVYLLAFFIIPLASMVPRMLRKRMKNKEKNLSQRTIPEKRQIQSNPEYSNESQIESSKFQPKNMLVLGELIRESKTFENIQKNTGLSNKELDFILGDLEENKMLKIHQKKGLLGIKIELYPTEKGIQKYHTYFEN
jgi:hypothetical protein